MTEIYNVIVITAASISRSSVFFTDPINMGCQPTHPVRIPHSLLPQSCLLLMLPPPSPSPPQVFYMLQPRYGSHHHISFITVTPNTAQLLRKKKVRDMKGKGEINNFPTEAAGLQETVGGKTGANFSASSCVEHKLLDGQALSILS